MRDIRRMRRRRRRMSADFQRQQYLYCIRPLRQTVIGRDGLRAPGDRRTNFSSTGSARSVPKRYASELQRQADSPHGTFEARQYRKHGVNRHRRCGGARMDEERIATASCFYLSPFEPTRLLRIPRSRPLFTLTIAGWAIASVLTSALNGLLLPNLDDVGAAVYQVP